MNRMNLRPSRPTLTPKQKVCLTRRLTQFLGRQFKYKSRAILLGLGSVGILGNKYPLSPVRGTQPVLQPQNQEIDKLSLIRKRRSTDYDALKLRKGLSGIATK